MGGNRYAKFLYVRMEVGYNSARTRTPSAVSQGPIGVFSSDGRRGRFRWASRSLPVRSWGYMEWQLQGLRNRMRYPVVARTGNKKEQECTSTPRHV